MYLSQKLLSGSEIMPMLPAGLISYVVEYRKIQLHCTLQASLLPWTKLLSKFLHPGVLTTLCLDKAYGSFWT